MTIPIWTLLLWLASLLFGVCLMAVLIWRDEQKRKEKKP